MKNVFDVLLGGFGNGNLHGVDTQSPDFYDFFLVNLVGGYHLNQQNRLIGDIKKRYVWLEQQMPGCCRGGGIQPATFHFSVVIFVKMQFDLYPVGQARLGVPNFALFSLNSDWWRNAHSRDANLFDVLENALGNLVPVRFIRVGTLAFVLNVFRVVGEVFGQYIADFGNHFPLAGRAKVTLSAANGFANVDSFAVWFVRPLVLNLGKSVAFHQVVV